MKPYQTIAIQDCGEPLEPIPADKFAFFSPHPYLAVGAPYGGVDPWYLRTSVLAALMEAQKRLADQKPGWKLYLFDAYRPNAVQAFMVEREFTKLALEQKLDPAHLTQDHRDMLAPQVFRLWGRPSESPLTPPPHSTGAVVDCTLRDELGTEVDMGSPIDENSDRSLPDYFSKASDIAGRAAHTNREFLREILEDVGFCRHRVEWWHFSIGDQYASWVQQEDTGKPVIARYGRADLAK